MFGSNKEVFASSKRTRVKEERSRSKYYREGGGVEELVGRARNPIRKGEDLKVRKREIVERGGVMGGGGGWWGVVLLWSPSNA